MRKANPETDFTVTVEGVGEFRYGRRTIGDSMKIRARFLDLVGGHDGDLDLSSIATVVATHDVLCVAAPDGWGDLLAVDSANPANIAKAFDLFNKVGEQEDSFRDPPKSNGAQAGTGAGQDAPVLVSA